MAVPRPGVAAYMGITGEGMGNEQGIGAFRVQPPPALGGHLQAWKLDS